MAAGESTRTRLGRNWPWVAAGAAVVLAVLVWAALAGEPGETPREALEDLRRSARQQEIARMVAGLDGVRSSDVILREPAEGSPAGASVTLEMVPGETLGPETASAVAGLVASAVPGLDPGEVVVVDARDPGRTHRLAPDADVAHEGAAVLRLRAQVERTLAEKIRGLFAGMQIECVAVVSAELDLDSVNERRLQLDPDGKGEFVVKEERSFELVAGREAQGALSGPEGGPLAGGSASLGGPARAGRGSSPVETRKTEFVIDRLTQEIARAPRGLAAVHASVVIFDRVRQGADGSWEYDRSVGDDENVERYTELVARALGLDRDQQSQVVLQYMPSPWTAPPAPAVRGPGAAGWFAVAALVAVGAVVAFAARAAMVRRAAAEAEREVPPAAPELHPAEELRRAAAEAASEDTERAAAVLHRWIAREGVS